MMASLDPAARRALRARAHHLHPVVSIGHQGLTPAVLREIDRALEAHELIKVRVFSDDREARDALLAQVCEALDAAPVQHLGKLLVLWRPAPADAAAKAPPRPHAKPFARTAHAAAKRGVHAARRGASTAKHGAPPAASQPRARSIATRGAPAAAPPPRTGSLARGKAHAAASSEGRAPRGVPRAALPRRRRGIG